MHKSLVFSTSMRNREDHGAGCETDTTTEAAIAIADRAQRLVPH